VCHQTMNLLACLLSAFDHAVELRYMRFLREL